MWQHGVGLHSEGDWVWAVAVRRRRGAALPEIVAWRVVSRDEWQKAPEPLFRRLLERADCAVARSVPSGLLFSKRVLKPADESLPLRELALEACRSELGCSESLIGDAVEGTDARSAYAVVARESTASALRDECGPASKKLLLLSPEFIALAMSLRRVAMLPEGGCFSLLCAHAGRCSAAVFEDGLPWTAAEWRDDLGELPSTHLLAWLAKAEEALGQKVSKVVLVGISQEEISASGHELDNERVVEWRPELIVSGSGSGLGDDASLALAASLAVLALEPLAPECVNLLRPQAALAEEEQRLTRRVALWTRGAMWICVLLCVALIADAARCRSERTRLALQEAQMLELQSLGLTSAASHTAERAAERELESPGLAPLAVGATLRPILSAMPSHAVVLAMRLKPGTTEVEGSASDVLQSGGLAELFSRHFPASSFEGEEGGAFRLVISDSLLGDEG